MGRKKKVVSKALATRPQSQGEYAALSRSPEEIKEIIESNVGQEGLTMMDLDRIKIPSGGTTVWQLPTLKGTENKESIEGVIVAHKQARVYWQEALDDTGGGLPPDCSSENGITGSGEPGGDCSQCPLNEWGSSGKKKGRGKTKARGKACKEIRMVFMLLPRNLIPVLFTLPPTSIVPMRKYLLKLASEGLPSFAVTTVFKLEKTKNNDGVEYSKASPWMGRELEENEIEQVRAYVKSIGPSIHSSRARAVDQADLES